MSRTLLPNGWADGIVGDYVYLKNGFAFKSNSYVPAGEETFPIIRISDLDGQNATDVHAVHVVNGVDGFEVHKGDLLIAMSGATTGKIGIYNGVEPAYQNQRVGNIKLHSELYGCNRFKNHLISSLSTQIIKIAYGGAQPNISSKDIDKIEILIPPLAEQKEIADRLDKLLAQVEATQARLARIPDIIKHFRQSVLAAAVSGKLTEEWRTSNGLKEIQSIVLDAVIESSFYGPRFGKSEYSPDASGIPTIRTTDMKDGVIEIIENTPRVTVPADKIEQFKINKNDLLVTRTGSIGVMALFTGNYIAIPSAYLIRFRFKASVLPKYVYYCLTSPLGQQQMGLSSTAITQPNINAKSIRAIEIKKPCMEEQTEIVRRVEQLFAYADSIEQQAKAAKARVDKLTQAILAQAFRGELTADWRAANPELISGDHSAAALLARIQTERATASGKKGKCGPRKPRATA